MDLGLGKDKQEALGEEAGNEIKGVAKSAGKGLEAGITQFSEDTREFVDGPASEFFLGDGYDKPTDGKNGKTYREINEEQTQRFIEGENRLEEEAPYKDIFNSVKNRTCKELNIAALAMVARDVAILGKTGIEFGKEGIEFLKVSSKKVTGKLSKETEELREAIMNLFGKGVGKTKYDNIDINNLKESNQVELDNIINDIRGNGGSPLDIPENATVNAKTMNKGYQQIKYNWSDGTYKYESRWHTETPGAVQYDRGTTWVVTRKIPGNAQGQRSVTECLAGDKWVSLKVWKDAEIANMAGTATQEQMDLLESGHWLAK
jgi:hypothetical protein